MHHFRDVKSYLSERNARLRVAGYYYLSNNTHNNTVFNDPDYVAMPNGPVHVLCQLMKEVMSSAAEAEIAGLFHNGKVACTMRITLEELGHSQHSRQSKLTTAPLVALLMILSNSGVRKPSTCVSIGSAIAFDKVSSLYTCEKAPSTWPIILLNIMPLCIILHNGPAFFTLRLPIGLHYWLPP